MLTKSDLSEILNWKVDLLLNGLKIGDKFIDSIKPLFKKRGIGKTALVSYKNSNFGVLRMFEIMVEKNMLNNRYASFRNIDEAKKWLQN